MQADNIQKLRGYRQTVDKLMLLYTRIKKTDHGITHNVWEAAIMQTEDIHKDQDVTNKLWTSSSQCTQTWKDWHHTTYKNRANRGHTQRLTGYLQTEDKLTLLCTRKRLALAAHTMYEMQESCKLRTYPKTKRLLTNCGQAKVNVQTWKDWHHSPSIRCKNHAKWGHAQRLTGYQQTEDKLKLLYTVNCEEQA